MGNIIWILTLYFDNINVDDKNSNSSQSEQANVKGKMFQFPIFGKKKSNNG